PSNCTYPARFSGSCLPRHFYGLPLIRLPLPISPLFPYTTLFRSDRPHGCHGVLLLFPVRPDALGRGIRDPDGDPLFRGGEEVPGDRKSTRLNYSHVSISYAVFCLEKINTG